MPFVSKKFIFCLLYKKKLCWGVYILKKNIENLKFSDFFCNWKNLRILFGFEGIFKNSLFDNFLLCYKQSTKQSNYELHI